MYLFVPFRHAYVLTADDGALESESQTTLAAHVMENRNIKMRLFWKLGEGTFEKAPLCNVSHQLQKTASQPFQFIFHLEKSFL